MRSASEHGDTDELVELLLPVLKVIKLPLSLPPPRRASLYKLINVPGLISSNRFFVLQARNVDLYINGHDHCLEHISSLDR